MTENRLLLRQMIFFGYPVTCTDVSFTVFNGSVLNVTNFVLYNCKTAGGVSGAPLL